MTQRAALIAGLFVACALGAGALAQGRDPRGHGGGGFARPEMSRPEMGRPEMGRPEMARPEFSRPAFGRPELVRPGDRAPGGYPYAPSARGYPGYLGYPPEAGYPAPARGARNSLGAEWRQQQEEAREGVRASQWSSLGSVIGRIAAHAPGRQLDSGIEYRDGRPVYRVRWITIHGRRVDYIVDAATGAILSDR